MKWIAILLMFLCFNVLGQDFTKIKHIEVLSKIQDSMLLINNSEINIINKTFYEKQILDSLNSINKIIISDLKTHNSKLDSIICNYKLIIQNDQTIKQQYRKIIEDYNLENIKSQKEIKNQKFQKAIWQSSTCTLAIILTIVLLI